MKRIRLTILFMLFCVFSFSQSIDIVSFNSSNEYCPGGGVSLHINPTGVFALENAGNLQDSANNSFILEISGPGGDWALVIGYWPCWSLIIGHWLPFVFGH